MNLISHLLRPTKYVLLEDGEKHVDNTTESPPHPYLAKHNQSCFSSARFYGIIASALIAITFFLGYFLGQHHQHFSVLNRFGTVPTPFIYNRTFSDPPSNQSEEAWFSIYPPNNGFFDGATADNERGTFAVWVSTNLHLVLVP